MILRRVQLADGRTRAFINDQAISVQTLKAVGTALVEIHGQHDERALVDAATHRRLLDAFAGLEKDVAALETLLGRAPRRACSVGRASRGHGARRPRGGLSAPCRRRTEEAQAKGRRGNGARRAPHLDDAGREDRRRSARGAGRGERQPFAGGGAGGGGAPAGTPRRQCAGLGGARGEGDRCRDQCAGGGRPAPHRGAGRGGFRSRGAGAHRGTAVRAARRVAEIFHAGGWAGGAGRRNMPPTSL